VGTQIVEGTQRAFVAQQGTGLSLLPLPSGYTSSEAYDVNSGGTIVGTATVTGSAADVGEPVVWIPGEPGEYTPLIPMQFDTLPGPLGEMPISGGQIVAINESGTLIGWSRYQGFQGGPATRFAVSGAPTDLNALGMQATPRDVNIEDVVVGGQLKFELSSETVSDIGVPPDLPGGSSFTNTIVFAINDSGESVVAANLASVPTENYLTFLHSDGGGYRRLNPEQLPSRFVGFYDNNNAGDVLASGGIYFADEDQRFDNLNELLATEFRNWTVSNGFIANNRRIYTTASDPLADRTALVVLAPDNDTIFESTFESSIRTIP
jgi:uncharacterized membrane protein